MNPAAKNTDRELWREKSTLAADPDNYYAPSIHVTAQGGIGINVGGFVIVKSLRDWHALAIAAAAREGGDVKQAPGDSPAERRSNDRIAQPQSNIPSKDSRYDTE